MRAPWQRLPLRVTLAILLVVLVGLSLAAVGVASTVALRGYLVNRIDEQLAETTHAFGERPGAPRPGPGDFAGDDDDRAGPRRFYVRYTSADGSQSIVASDLSGENQPTIPSWTLAEAQALGPDAFTIEGTNSNWRVDLEPLRGNSGYVVVAAPLAEVAATVGQLALLELVIGLIAMAVVALLGYLLVRRTLRPLAEVEQTATTIARDGELTQRVPVQHPESEAGQLATSFNTMVDRIASSFAAVEASEAEARASEERMRRFVGDASHELRTPLTTIRGFAELYRQGAVPPDKVASVMSRIEGEADRMGVLVGDLLLLARMDQQRPLEQVDVDLLGIVTDAVAGMRAAYADRRIDLSVDLAGGPAYVLGDHVRLRQVVDNLLSNACRHTPVDAQVSVRLSSTAGGPQGHPAGWAEIAVSDTGPGMTPEVAARVFERFYRPDESRNRDLGGTGLGLAIVRSLVVAHGGEVLLDTAPGEGARFTVRLRLTGGSQGHSSGEPARAGTVDA